MGKSIKCKICEGEVDKIAIGLTKKLLVKESKRFYCLDCLSAYLDVAVEDLFAKAEEFREEGCTLFL